MKERSRETAGKTIEYIMKMRPVLNVAAFFSDETENYIQPMEPEIGETVTVFFRTARNNVDTVILCRGETRDVMQLHHADSLFDYYSASFTAEDELMTWFFEIRSGKFICYFNKLGMLQHPSEDFAFRVRPGFHTPGWTKGAVMYQILTDRFCNGDPSNDVLSDEYAYIKGRSVRVTDWMKRPAAMGVREFYGGDLQGVMDKLDYLQKLGVEVLYFNPLFVSPSNHKYDIQDYDYIDPHFGPLPLDEGELLYGDDMDNTHATRFITRVTRKENLEAANELFVKMVEECHRRGMRVILDGVFNHCGSFNKWMDRERIYENQEGYEKGAFISADSPYRSFFRFGSDQWPYNEDYDGWWGHNTLPKLNYEDSARLEDYILKIAVKWVSPPYNADGWRLDVAADLGYSLAYNHSFWKKFRKAVKAANPDAVILAEHYGDPNDWLKGDEWDTVMNYDAFMEPLTWFFTGMEKHSDHKDEGLLGNADFFSYAMRYNMARFMGPSLLSSMNELSNHDHSRFLTRTNGIVGRMDHFDYDAAADKIQPAVMREAILMQVTWPGSPTVYYGDEAGVCGFTDPDNRRTYPWGREDLQMLGFYRDAIRMHKHENVLKYGSILPLHGNYNIMAYGRFGKDGVIVSIFNNNDEEHFLEFRVWSAGLEDDAALFPLIASSAQGAWARGEDGKWRRSLWTDDAAGNETEETVPEAETPGWPSMEYRVTEGKLIIMMPAKSAVVLKRG